MRLEISSFKRIVVLTGAGISAESGVPTFRDSNGLWEKHRIEDVATPEAFEADPVLVWKFYSMRRAGAAAVMPNRAHRALARFAFDAAAQGTHFTLVTQNVDMLHERASAAIGAPAPIAMHGSLGKSRCSHCDKVYTDQHPWLNVAGEPSPALPTKPRQSGQADQQQENDSAEPERPTEPPPLLDPVTTRRNRQGLPLSPCCYELLRPHIVWFGEIPLEIPLIQKSLASAELFVTIGTSGVVYPAAGFLEQAKIAGAVTACLNKDPLPQQRMVDFFFEGPATETVPRLFTERP